MYENIGYTRVQIENSIQKKTLHAKRNKLLPTQLW